MYKAWKGRVALSPEAATTLLVVACLAFLIALMWWTL
jgi:hypothetical protein